MMLVIQPYTNLWDAWEEKKRGYIFLAYFLFPLRLKNRLPLQLLLYSGNAIVIMCAVGMIPRSAVNSKPFPGLKSWKTIFNKNMIYLTLPINSFVSKKMRPIYNCRYKRRKPLTSIQTGVSFYLGVISDRFHTKNAWSFKSIENTYFLYLLEICE